MATFPDNVDFSTFPDATGVPDMDPDWKAISGARSVMEKVARRWVTQKGEMHDPDFGYSIVIYYNASMLPIEVQALQAGLRVEALKVEGLDDISVTVMKDYSGVVWVYGSLTLEDDGGEAGYWKYVFQLNASVLNLITLLPPGSS